MLQEKIQTCNIEINCRGKAADSALVPCLLCSVTLKAVFKPLFSKGRARGVYPLE